MRFCVLVFSFIIFGTTPSDVIADGNKFLTSCQHALELVENANTQVDQVSAGVCVGYITAVTDVYYRAKHSDVRIAICLPDKASVLQTIRVYVSFLEEHPERLHEFELDLLNAALAEAFPCD